MDASKPAHTPPQREGVSEFDQPDGLREFRRYTYWSMVAAALVLLGLPMVTGPVPLPPHPLGMVTAAAASLVAAAVARLTTRHIPRHDAPALSTAQWRVWAFVGGVAALTVSTTSVVAGDDILWIFAPAMVVSLLLAHLPRRRRQVAGGCAVMVAGAAGVVVAVARGDDPLTAFPFTGAIVTAFVLMLTLTTLWTWRVAVELDDARRTAATLAVANERLRFAADLHDIQGHHLQVIALKSELASRLLHADPDAAEHEMSAVRQLASDALHDTRAVVHGYRRVTLEAEIANASNVLESAGIDSELRVDPVVHSDRLSPSSRHLLGLVLREAVTNILRHSDASWAEVTLARDEDGHVRLTVTNDGADLDATTSFGRLGGLDDLAERLDTAGGTLTWEHAEGRFRVRARVPAGPAPAAASGEGE